MGRFSPPEGGPEALLITSAHQEVRARRLASEDGEARLYAVSEGKKKAETSILGLRRNRFEAALERLHSGLLIKGRLKQRFSAVARHYEVTVEKANTGPNASAVRLKRRPQYDEADETAGAYVLRTSHIDWDIETILRTYWRITDIEATFNSLKSELGLRPIWHQLDHRIAAHLLIAVLAYHAVHLIRIRLAARGIHKCWASIRESMRTWVRITTRLRQTTASAAAASVARPAAPTAAPSRRTSSARNAPPSGAAIAAWTVQVRRGAKASISASRSHTSRSATDCTRPAERQPGSLRHSTGDRPYPSPRRPLSRSSSISFDHDGAPPDRSDSGPSKESMLNRDHRETVETSHPPARLRDFRAGTRDLAGQLREAPSFNEPSIALHRVYTKALS